MKERLLRWWYYFKLGHGPYLAFGLSFSQWLVVLYMLAITRIPILQMIFPHFWTFALAFLFTYVPLATVIGWWHRHHVIKIESTIGFEERKSELVLYKTVLENQVIMMKKLGLSIPPRTIERMKWLERKLSTKKKKMK